MARQAARREDKPPAVLDRPPDLEVVTGALATLLRSGGLPATEETADPNLLALRGVWARSIDPDDVLSRVTALNGLLLRQITALPEDGWPDAGLMLFGAAKGTKSLSLMKRRAKAAEALGYDETHFRKHIEGKILRQLARQLHADSQSYIPRHRDVPPQLETSGDTPKIAVGDVTDKERNQHEEHLSRLWSYVYGLRAELLVIERCKRFPDEASDAELQEAAETALWQVARLLQSIHDYISTYGERIMHGEAEFNAEGLIRLAGWTPALTKEQVQMLRLAVAQYGESKANFIEALAATKIGVDLLSRWHKVLRTRI